MKKNFLQKNIFLKKEGDSYFNRNKDAVSIASGLGNKLYEKFLRKHDRILEIGCSNGDNLNYFQTRKKCQCFGIDPSVKAILAGKKKYPAIKLDVGTADKLNFPDEYFNFVFFGFCLYLIDRPLLLRCIAEADRVLKNRGLLGVTDFDTKIPFKRPYKHRKGVYVFKYDYQKLFESCQHYTLIEKISYSHSTDYFVEGIQERLSTVILYKDYDLAYIKG